MLRTRVITALVLLAVLLPALFVAPAVVFAVVAGVFACAAMWEWARLAGHKPLACLLWAAVWLGAAAALLFGTSVATLASRQLTGALAISAVAWAALLASSLPRAALPRSLSAPPVLSALGFVVLFAAWLALMRARGLGSGFLLSVLLVAWVADVAAYFGGRAVGGAKLAPRISPGKTWAGVWSAAAAVVVYALVCTLWPALSDTLFARIGHLWGLPILLVCSLALLALTIMGDLFESLLKRHAGVKDSSGLLPGHGGVLDRIDALLPLLPIALLLLS